MALNVNDPFIDQHWAKALTYIDTHQPELPLDAAYADLKRLGEACESPIEAIFAGYWVAFTVGFNRKEFALRPQWVAPELKRLGWRLDFSIELGGVGPMKVAVELDGHEWHERTPEQVEARNDRDRHLQLSGWKVLHYSGREVVREGVKTAGSAWLVAYQRAARRGWLDAR